MKKCILLAFILLNSFYFIHAESGYDLWLRYNKVREPAKQLRIESIFSQVKLNDTSKTSAIIKDELKRASEGMVGITPLFNSSITGSPGLIIYTGHGALPESDHLSPAFLENIGTEGYIISIPPNENQPVILAANTEQGGLYGVFHLLRHLQSESLDHDTLIIETPKVSHRLLNHWDNLDRTVERGYAGFSIWDWHKLPGYIDQRYTDYARANASIGINGTVVTNVNANALVLTPSYIEKVAALADVFRPFGIKIYLTARFSAPIEIGGLKTADPLNEDVIAWWNRKAEDIYSAIPDFGGFLVKANSEGQPGPQNYDRSHADGANMLARAIAKHGGIVMWRAFVYSHESPEDRAKQAVQEFKPLDGSFEDNVVIQVKNGPIDFQPREPFHPLFGSMPKTKLALELQITQEYLGQGTSLAYLAPMYKECLESVTYRPTKHSTVAEIIDGSAYGDKHSVMAGVSNIGNDINWTGHPFGQANWYAFGRLAWNHDLSSESIASEWIKLTFGTDPKTVSTISQMMLNSHEAVVNYMTPMGLHHIMGRGHHYGPGPWVTGGRADWTSVYYHRADEGGIGFDRTAAGSNALGQYADEIVEEYENPSTCPEKFLLWFHHLPWTYRLESDETVWESLCFKYGQGVDGVREMTRQWKTLDGQIDGQRYKQISQLLDIQLEEARWWRNACLLYFQDISGIPFPPGTEIPEGELEDYMKMQFPYAPGIRPTW